MSWSPDFLAALEQRQRSVKIRARVVLPANNAGVGGSADLPDVVDFRMQGARVTPATWASTLGGFVVTVGTTNAASVHNYVRRGSIIEVLVGFGNWSEARYEVVARGRVRNVTGLLPRLAIECVDLLSSMLTRPAKGNIEKQYLFHDAGAPVGPYTATSSGHHITAATVFTMGATIDQTEFTFDSGVGAGLLYVDDGTNTCYLTYTGISGRDFTGVAIVGSFGSTKPAPRIITGATVTHVPYLRDHPADIARRVLASTGSASNGSFDTAPLPWGFAFEDGWLDHMGFGRWSGQVMIATSGTYEWEVKVDARVTSGLTWLTGLFQPAGCWLTMRQGEVTFRAAQDVYPPTIDSGIHITDADIAIRADGSLVPPSYSAWDPAVPAEYGRVKVTGPTTSQATDSANGIGSMPAGYVKEYSLADVAWQNEGAVLAGDRNRLLEWGMVVPELVRLTCGGLRMAQLCPGDHVRMSSQLLTGRLERAGTTFDYRRAMVTAITPDWMRGRVALELSLPPEKNHTEQG